MWNLGVSGIFRTFVFSGTIIAAVTSFAISAIAYDGFQDWYPSVISPPSGHKYSCALTALPKDLTGIPASDKQFINHVYAMLLKALEAKLVMLDTLMQEHQSYGAAYARYYADTSAARQKIMAEPVPNGLLNFRNTVITAIDQQAQFFGQATKARQSGQPAQSIQNIPEGRQASATLQSAWAAMQSRYPNMSSTVRDSTYHHLCALDLF